MSRLRSVLFVGVALSMAGAFAARAGAHAQTATSQDPVTSPPTPALGARSASDGVYTAEQAKRGQTIYATTCSKCHGDSLEGGEEAPSLAGPGFMSNWTGTTVGDLVERTRVSMPDDNPGSLSRQQDTDVVTYILSMNRYPAGKTELDTDAQRQKLIRITPIK